MPGSLADQAPSSNSSAHSLLQRVRAHDSAAWRRLSHVYSPLVYQWCRRAGTQPADAADVVQDVFLSVYRTIEGFQAEQPRDAFRGWLWTITRNKLRDRARQAVDRPAAAGGTDARLRLEQISDSAPEDSDESLRASVTSELTRRALSLLQSDFEERTWSAFWGVTVEGRSPADVAAELGMSRGGVYMAKSRVLQRLREELDGLL